MQNFCEIKEIHGNTSLKKVLEIYAEDNPQNLGNE